MAADWFLPLDEVGLRCLTEANGVNVSYPRLLHAPSTPGQAWKGGKDVEPEISIAALRV